MIGLLIISHGDLSKGVLDAANLITEQHELVEYLGIKNNESGTDFHKKIEEEINRLYENGADDVVLLIDLFGGTPFNQAMQLFNKVEVKGITGVNLPMLISALMNDRKDTKVDEYINTILEDGKKGIVNISELGL